MITTRKNAVTLLNSDVFLVTMQMGTVLRESGLGFRSLKKHFNDVGFAIKFEIVDLVKINNFF